MSASAPPLGWLSRLLPDLAAIASYSGARPQATSEQGGARALTWLASNENLLGASPLAIRAATESLDDIHRYPDHSRHGLKAALAEHLATTPGSICLGGGSGELIEVLVRVFLSEGGDVVAPALSFIGFRLCAQLVGARYIEAPLGDGFAVDVDAILATLTPATKLVILANPGNPTGSWLSLDATERLAAALEERGVPLVLDFAYWEFARGCDFNEPLAILARHSNVVLLRTFSKAYGLAGLRIGYAVAEPSLIAILERCRMPYSVTLPALNAALESLRDSDYLNAVVGASATSSQQLRQGLERLGLSVHAGPTNFVLVGLEASAGPVCDELLKRGIVVRSLANYGLDRYFRVSCGTAAENAAFLRQMSHLRGDL